MYGEAIEMDSPFRELKMSSRSMYFRKKTGLVIIQDEIANFFSFSVKRPQRFHEVGILQKADVHDQVCLRGQTVFITE
ncbi:hypothetical protein DSCO28_73530 (plasmid) [Desulfosarcina ovata subsp. sediminis]|uniref:Uncharacterized protein n=1 Tax=Desulfosarcina ovata subsp. sediminis TaxID=885957 RepID=A0A5K8A2R7_9BACT|nr:hypothetical protein DSCO28_73530 [Desulfosarcina ovata subsp. sediminis]